MKSISVKLDGEEFNALEVQISALIQSGVDLAVTSPLLIHVVPADPVIVNRFERQLLEAGEDGLSFKSIEFQAVLEGEDVVTIVGEDLTLGAVQQSAFATFVVRSLRMVY